MKPKPCKDCTAEGRQGPVLNAPYPGPRCYRHHKSRQRTEAAQRAANRRQIVYSLTPERYDAILEAQGGGCGICERKPGQRRLAVDHDHACCPGKTSCGECVRGLLCWSCNKYLQHIRDDPETMQRGANYMQDPPASLILAPTVNVT